REFGYLEHYQPARRQRHDLAAQLGTDRAAGARDQDRLAAHAGAEQCLIGWHRIPTQQIVHVDVADFFQSRVARDDLADVRDREYLESHAAEGLDDLTATAARGAGHR